MLITQNPMNILDYCNDFVEGKIKVDVNYQRTDRVWPEPAKKYLIESILLGYPVPKLFLHQKIDAKSKTAVKFVVDGQQRSKAILEYFQNKFAISKKCREEEIAGKSFETLPEDYQNKFLSYPLPIDLFVTASRDEIIETFRRINSYTVPLNAEEKRHSYHQGEIKWFVHELATRYSDKLANLGVFSDKNLARMADYKFYAELVCYIDNNEIITTTAKTLDSLYLKYDKSFPMNDLTLKKIVSSIDLVIDWEWLKGMKFTSTQIFQMLIATIIFNPEKHLLPEQKIKENISEISEALEVGHSVEFHDFLVASSKTTNDGKRRKIIAEFISNAIFA